MVATFFKNLFTSDPSAPYLRFRTDRGGGIGGFSKMIFIFLQTTRKSLRPTYTLLPTLFRTNPVLIITNTK